MLSRLSCYVLPPDERLQAPTRQADGWLRSGPVRRFALLPRRPHFHAIRTKDGWPLRGLARWPGGPSFFVLRFCLRPSYYCTTLIWLAKPASQAECQFPRRPNPQHRARPPHSASAPGSADASVRAIASDIGVRAGDVPSRRWVTAGRTLERGHRLARAHQHRDEVTAAPALPPDLHRQFNDRFGDLCQCLNALRPELRFAYGGLSRLRFERCHGFSRLRPSEFPERRKQSRVRRLKSSLSY